MICSYLEKVSHTICQEARRAALDFLKMAAKMRLKFNSELLLVLADEFNENITHRPILGKILYYASDTMMLIKLLNY